MLSEAVCDTAGTVGWPYLSFANGCGMGIRIPCGHHDRFQLWRKTGGNGKPRLAFRP